MIEPIIVASIVLYFFTKSIFFPEKPKEKSKEAMLGDALVKYLEEGVRTKT